jgi:hypothetical protein
MNKDIVHSLIASALESCDPKNQTATADDEKCYSKETVRALYNLASFDRTRFYIPGETAFISKNREQFVLWGGLVALYYISTHAQHPDVKKFCENTKLKDIETVDLDLINAAIKSHIDSKKQTTGEKKPGETPENPPQSNIEGEEKNTAATRGAIMNAIMTKGVTFPE